MKLLGYLIAALIGLAGLARGIEAIESFPTPEYAAAFEASAVLATTAYFIFRSGSRQAVAHVRSLDLSLVVVSAGQYLDPPS